MNDIIDVQTNAERAEGLKAWGWASYVLHLIVALGAVIPGAQGTWQASHFSYRIRTVLWAGVLYVLTAPLWLLLFLPGWIAWCLISLWFLYRIVRGMVAMNRSEALVV
jgi:uncharacterized membrane protein